MNINYQETREKVKSESEAISDVLSKLKENDEEGAKTKKEGVSLLDITKKLSSKKFDKKKAK